MTTPARIATLAVSAVLTVTAATSARGADSPSVSGASPGLKGAQTKIAAGDFNGAIHILKLYVSDHPRDANGFNLLGYSLRRSGQTADALKYYNRALELVPQHPGANEYLGELYVEMGQLDKAKERLAVLKASCGGCEEYRDLAVAISKAEKRS